MLKEVFILLAFVAVFSEASNFYFTDCLVGKGESYTGVIAKTVSGTKCQRWNSQYPHTPTETVKKLLRPVDHRTNYCRNPGGKEDKPWCYTLSSKRWDYCHIPKCKSCLEGKGASYTGTVRTTVSGLTCQRWDAKSPHVPYAKTVKLLSVDDVYTNFCRNPGGKELRPWCYTTSSKRWEYCNIPQCKTCQQGNGESYSGSVAKTASGLTCQRWNSVSPHVPHFKSYKLLSVDDRYTNYCRNPAGKATKPWCYTTSSSKRLELCNIPKC